MIPLADGTRERVSNIVDASGLPAAGLVRADGGRDGNSPGGLAPEEHFSHLHLEGHPEGQDLPSTERVHLVPLLVEPHSGGEDVGGSVAVRHSNALTNVLSTRVRFPKRGHEERSHQRPLHPSAVPQVGARGEPAPWTAGPGPRDVPPSGGGKSVPLGPTLPGSSRRDRRQL